MVMTYSSPFSILALFSIPLRFVPLKEHDVLERQWVVDSNKLGFESESQLWTVLALSIFLHRRVIIPLLQCHCGD